MPQDYVQRFFGGPPLAVIGRLILMSILVGVILAAIGLDPWNIVEFGAPADLAPVEYGLRCRALALAVFPARSRDRCCRSGFWCGSPGRRAGASAGDRRRLLAPTPVRAARLLGKGSAQSSLAPPEGCGASFSPAYRLIARPAVAATPPVQRKAVGRPSKPFGPFGPFGPLGAVAALPLLRRLLRLSAGDEGRQPFDVLLALLREVLRAGLAGAAAAFAACCCSRG